MPSEWRGGADLVRDPFCCTSRYQRGRAGGDGALRGSITISKSSCEQANEPPMPAAAADRGTAKDRWEENRVNTTTTEISPHTRTHTHAQTRARRNHEQEHGHFGHLAIDGFLFILGKLNLRCVARASSPETTPQPLPSLQPANPNPPRDVLRTP